MRGVIERRVVDGCSSRLLVAWRRRVNPGFGINRRIRCRSIIASRRNCRPKSLGNAGAATLASSGAATASGNGNISVPLLFDILLGEL
jgi:hypothetical protein